MSLINLVAGGAAAALALVKQYVGNPTLIYNGASVPIQTFRYVPRIEADVSRKVLIDMTGKKFVTDNVAPGPHEWHIEGYIGGLPLELSSLFMPSIGVFRDVLDEAFLSRQPLDFYDADQKAWTLAGGNPVLITVLEFEKLPDTENRLLVRIDLRELFFLSAQVTSISPLDKIASAATPTAGGAAGVPADSGATEAVAETNVSSPTTSWGNITRGLVENLR
jgi:hypothetical protein